ncbi:MAG: VOC family protein [Planctomycetota bacterium]|nr:MAG: VOC family protein [Planctomycetota bacterium]
MRFEHIALNVAEPQAMAAWYVQHLGLRVRMAMDQPPYGHFLVDDGGIMMLELYYNPNAPCPDPGARHHSELHLALHSSDAVADTQRLCAAGASHVEWVHPDDGSCISMLRDPWGLAWQLCQRAQPWENSPAQ